MILSPLTKKVEIYVGYKGFYTYGDEKITLTIEEAGVGVLVDTREIFNLNRGSVVKYFKPMVNLSEGKKYIENEFVECASTELPKHGFIRLKEVNL